MTNLPITINNPQLPAKSTSGDVPLPRSSPTVTANAATGTAQKNDATAQPADPFGAVLARRMQADEANASASNTSLAPVVDTKADSIAATGKTEQDKIPAAADIPNDPSSILAAMLQFPQEIKPLTTKDAIASTKPRGLVDTAAIAQGVADTAVASQAMAGVAAIRETSANKADMSQLAVDGGAIQAKVGLGMAAATSGKAEAVVTNTDNLVVADKLALRTGSGLEIIKPPELPISFPDAARSAQNIAQSAASVAASGMLPNMLTNDKTANSLQTISSPLGSSGWADEFSQKITWMGTQQNQVAELHLNPPNLGPLDVVLKISDNQATALFTSPHSAVRDAVESALPKLREMLADNGIMLGNTMVSDQSPRDRSADGFMNHGNGTATQREAPDDALRISSTAAQAIPMRRHNGMVDTFA